MNESMNNNMDAPASVLTRFKIKMTKQNYPINDPALKNYVEVLEQTVKDSPKGLPKRYDKIKSLEERAEILE